MKVKKISIKNILGIDELEINAGAVTLVQGENGSGKTSVIEAIKSIFQGGYDATLLKNGAERGEIVLLLDDGTEVKKVYSTEASNLTVTHPIMGRISRTAEFIKRLSDSLSVNPIEFLNADHKKRAEYLLEALPLKVIPADFDGITLSPVTDALCNAQHPFVTIAAIQKMIYDERTGTNRALKDKRASVEELSKTLPQDAGTDFSGQEAELVAKIEAVQKQASTLKDASSKQYLMGREMIINTHNVSMDDVKKREDEQLEALRVEYTARKTAVLEQNKALRDDLEKVKADRLAKEECVQNEAEALQTGFNVQINELKVQLAGVREKVKESARLSAARELVARYTAEAVNLETASKDLSTRLEKLEALKQRLASALPIPGIEVKDGQIYRDGIPFDRLNTAQQIEIAVKVAAIRAKELKLICVDGIESLDDTRLKEFEQIIKVNDLQAIMTRVASEKMTVNNL